jgi:hypothetical protein
VSESDVAFETEADLNLGNLADPDIRGGGGSPRYSRYVRLLGRLGLLYGAYFIKLD